MKVTEQEEDPVEPVSGQGDVVKVPSRLLEKATVPLEVEVVPAAESVTVAVQVVVEPSTIDAGVQLTDVVVGLFETV